MSEPVIITEYNAEWPDMYGEEKARILNAAGQKVIAIEHFGSTAVPGLGAKPIIDIMAGVRHLVEAEECIEPLHDIGYEFVPPERAGISERRYFHRHLTCTPSCHLHMVEQGSAFWEQHLLFRDYLRSHPDVAREYYELKLVLAAKYRTAREEYTEAKTPFIQSVLAKARIETEMRKNEPS